MSDTDTSSTASLTDEDSRTSSCRLSRVPLRLVLRDRRALEGREAPKKSSIASVVSSAETREARGVRVRAGVGCASCASISMSCAGVVGRSKRPKKVGREVGEEDEDATGEDIVGGRIRACQVSSKSGDGSVCSGVGIASEWVGSMAEARGVYMCAGGSNWMAIRIVGAHRRWIADWIARAATRPASSPCSRPHAQTNNHLAQDLPDLAGS